jgi:hypothetical protein
VKTMVPVIKIDGAKIKNQILYDAITWHFVHHDHSHQIYRSVRS